MQNKVREAVLLAILEGLKTITLRSELWRVIGTGFAPTRTEKNRKGEASLYGPFPPQASPKGRKEGKGRVVASIGKCRQSLVLWGG